MNGQNKIRLLLLAIAIATLTSGCASAVGRHQSTMMYLDGDIDCHNAQHHVSQLQKSKSTPREKLANSVASILPTSIVFNLLAGEYSSRYAIASGKFDKEIDNRIMEIEDACQPEKA